MVPDFGVTPVRGFTCARTPNPKLPQCSCVPLPPSTVCLVPAVKLRRGGDAAHRRRSGKGGIADSAVRQGDAASRAPSEFGARSHLRIFVKALGPRLDCL